MSNQIMAIRPYFVDHLQTWAFDDPTTNLKQELFVAGIPKLIEKMLDHYGLDIKDSRKRGFIMTFSAGPFPGWQEVVNWQRGEIGGSWYAHPDWKDEEGDPMCGWLCPALFKYFDDAPAQLFVSVMPLAK